MPATKEQRLYNPLRKLRVVLGELGAPLHQEAFAARIGIPVATVRSVESGRRPMTQDNCLGQILLSLQATWNPRDQEWHVLGSRHLYKKEHANLARKLYHDDAYVEDLSLHYLLERVLCVFSAASVPEKRVALHLKLNNVLEEAVADFGLPATCLEGTEPTWMQSTHPIVWGKELAKPVVWWPRYLTSLGEERQDPGPHAEEVGEAGIFDFRRERSFNPADYPARTRGEAEAALEAVRERRKKAQGRSKRKNNRTQTVPKMDEGQKDGQKSLA
jgi:hypothetical protein